MNKRLFAFVLAFPMFCPSFALAQLAQGELRGVVADESGAVLPGVTVTATNLETGTSRTTTTGSSGDYLMPAMPLGSYKMTAELPGFGTVVREGFRLGVGESVSINFSMKVAQVQETVTVSGEAPLIDTKKSELTGHVDPEQVQSLPLNGRNWLDLVSMVPGARGTLGDIRAGASGNDATRYQMDGLNVTGQGTGGETQSYSQEVVGEVQVLTNRFDAEYGRVTGAVINAVTKAGTNAFHGSGYYYLRDDKMDATNWLTGTVTPLHQAQPGGTVGGPIVRDKAFFFGGYEYQTSDVSNRPTTGNPLLDVSVDAPQTRHLIDARVDEQINNKHRMFFRTDPFKEHRNNEAVGSSNGRATANAGDNYDAFNEDGVFGETWVVNDRLVNEVRAGVFYFNKQLEALAAIPRLSFPSAIFGPASNTPQWWREKIFQTSESFTYFRPTAHGAHHVKAGFQYQRSYYQGELPSASYGQFNFSKDPTNFFDPSTYPAPTSYSISFGDFGYNYLNPAYGAYSQDDWTVSSRLTLNLGVRYDLEPSVTNPGYEVPAVESGTRHVPRTNIAPRLGFAYDIRGDGRSVIRGGIGRYYGNILLNIPMNEVRNRNRQVSLTVLNPSLTDPLQGAPTFDQLFARPRNLVVMSNDYNAPRQDQVSIGMAEQVTPRLAVHGDYVHLNGAFLPMSVSTNFFENAALGVPLNPLVAGRPYPQYVNITDYESVGTSRYDAIQLGATERRAAGGRFDFTASYTLSWTKDSTDANRFGTVNNPFNVGDEYAVAANDQRHRIVGNITAYLPYDIEAAGILFLGSGEPINIATSLDPFGMGITTGRWLDAQGDVLPKNAALSQWSKKVDVRVVKNIRLVHGARLQGMLDIFNVFNTANYDPTTYGTQFGTKTYLQPAYSSNLFFQPRMLQIGARLTY
ncbi:MAG TPA: carboxypeptidase regulatory-like domain-containing protein [Vicinamibacterales bacterium]|nr:carboxypeptidase regulatory-like domain-containing protein [Vicinamibacterales bacterium]